ncbi:exopolyphosphatase [Candidatus Methylacidiphilum infernorum]|uniref:Exopolyphosphatase n=1 Tax=Candidatus Methylacidiphilum infernorum TaxID=511746 RepID=A0ABX7PSV8_9BACT|nr:exopolyphosphatase [Candidatus Methylacidiphilum infernorum]QSR86055.1 exopolyphosphatase [Candidatus Methylacidiphilum infernorum]
MIFPRKNSFVENKERPESYYSLVEDTEGFAVFDIGSNTIKFLAARQKRDNTIEFLLHQSFTTKLAEGLFFTGELSPEAIYRTLDILSLLRRQADELGLRSRIAAATSAVRDSKNRKYFLKKAEEILGHKILLLSGDDEAKIIYRGVCSDPLLQGQASPLTVVDVGGGSSEWIQGKEKTPEYFLSLPLGAIRVRDRFVSGYPVGTKTVARMLHCLEKQLQDPLREIKGGCQKVIGTGGTISTMANIFQQSSKEDFLKTHHFPMDTDSIQKKLEELAHYDLEQLSKIPGLPLNRVEIIIPGMAVVFATLSVLGSNTLVSSIRGLRYGLLDLLVTEKLQVG